MLLRNFQLKRRKYFAKKILVEMVLNRVCFILKRLLDHLDRPKRTKITNNNSKNDICQT